MDQLEIIVQKTGGIWHGTIKGFPEVDERGLTEEIARRKVTAVADRLRESAATRQRGGSGGAMSEPSRAVRRRSRRM